jgi:hypothetical protein
MVIMNECEIWQGSKRKNGYGVKVVNYKRKAAHRWAWEIVIGEIPEGYVLDHKCHSQAVSKGECQGGFTCVHRACINLDHLELVTQSENVRRGLHAIENRATCKKGHDYKDPNNIMIRANGKRECSQCNRDRASMNYRKKVALAY